MGASRKQGTSEKHIILRFKCDFCEKTTKIALKNVVKCRLEHPYASLGGSNGCADQLTNWDGTKKLGLGAITKKKGQSY